MDFIHFVHVLVFVLYVGYLKGKEPPRRKYANMFIRISKLNKH